MNTWKRFSVFAMSLFLVAMLAACGGGSSSGTTDTSGQGNQATASTPTVDASTPTPVPTNTPTTSTTTSTGGCTTAESCQKAVMVVSPEQARPGEKVTVTVKGWIANAKANVSAGVQVPDSDTVSTTSDAQGNFSVTLTIRPNTPDFGPTNILVILDSSTDDGARNLQVSGKLTIVK